MKTFNKILFPVDLSDDATQITPWVKIMAEKFGAEIHLLFVVRTVDHLATLNDVSGCIGNYVLWSMEEAKARLEEYSEKNFTGYPDCTTKVSIGDPAHNILEYVMSEEVDLVIMGTHGRKGLNRVIFGSVTDSVLKKSPVPVVTVNPYRVLEPEIEMQAA